MRVAYAAHLQPVVALAQQLSHEWVHQEGMGHRHDDALSSQGDDDAAALALLGIGATGYGLSLRFYLLAQRAFGAARTGSVFAFAPFIGAALALMLGDRGLSLWVALGGVLMLAGVVVHLLESHGHEHTHEPLAHDHAHCHDDGHHDHTHDVPPTGPHSHPHHHARVTHTHAHVPDVHHAHSHDQQAR